MSVYLSNYWLLYSEFLNIFKELKYRDIPIAIMTNFYQQIDEDLKKLMVKNDFHLQLKHANLTTSSDIQSFFEDLLKPLNNPIKNLEKGKTLINLDYIRISGRKMNEIFNKEKTVILSRSKNETYLEIPNLFIGKFKVDTTKYSSKLIESANEILNNYQDHPALGNSYFKNTFIQRIPLIVDTIETVFNLYEQIVIATVLVGTSEDMVSRALGIVGLMKGIPSICLQHGILMGEEAFMPVFTSHIAVYGEYEKRWYMHRGVQAERIATIGHPRYDDIFNYPKSSKNEFLKKYKLEENKITILIATGPNTDSNKFKKMVSLLVRNKIFQILIKPHPWELAKNQVKLYMDLKRQYKSVHVVTDRSVLTHELISHSDLVVASLSTVALESCLFNKPTFVYYFVQSNRHYDYFDRLGKYIQSDPTEIVNIMSYYFYSTDEKLKYEEVKTNFLIDSYNVKNSGKELSNLVNELARGEKLCFLKIKKFWL
ncbi:CDP-glycerol glycerophosphotransferase family protein [Gottfriedia luciferensis]|uniref:CDP-glycerol glycerophosphotransferase family protein n=1 Tax=Gottfriedia luciferensis TaxID=178774 RepID=UPI000B437606|nr:CDP-glycerol glycerophosphotransferase family protein [Gottfriedia luciferensis]